MYALRTRPLFKYSFNFIRFYVVILIYTTAKIIIFFIKELRPNIPFLTENTAYPFI